MTYLWYRQGLVNDIKDDRVEHKTVEAHSPRELAGISLAALGVVFGDIGTSPLYALRECFYGHHALPVTPENVLGVLSLILWSLIIVVSVKYILWVMRADNKGEGGILALLALALHRIPSAHRRWLVASFGIFGAALMYGDGVITPAISVLSAVEGLNVITNAFEPMVVPLTLGILVVLFSIQSRGTARIGAIFGPVLLIWFLTIGIMGLVGMFRHPDVFRALNPIYAVRFFMHNGLHGFLTLGAVFLCCTGGEALYADMGHFGRKPIKLAWFAVVLPGLVLNYFGQGALLLADPSAAENPFYKLAPSWALYPYVALATLATTIASQALISGAFSLTQQAMQLGYSPRLQIKHTSSREIGQIYIPYVNWTLLAGTLWLVVTFRSSSALAAAYGIAVASTMVITTLLASVVSHRVWHWSLARTLLVAAGFLVFDLAFFGANVAKIFQGGYIPILIGAAIFTLMTTWHRGRAILAERLRERSVSVADFLSDLRRLGPHRIKGTAIFMTGDPHGAPPALLHNFRHNRVLHEHVCLLTIQALPQAYVARSESMQKENLGEGMSRVIVAFGFMEKPSIHEVIELLNEGGFSIKMDEVTFFLGRETLIATKRPGMAMWREHLFAFMSRNAQRATAFFGIPVDQVIEVGVQVEI